MSKRLIAQLANAQLVLTTILLGGVIIFVMMATTMQAATGMVVIAVWEQAKTTTGALFVLAWILLPLNQETDVDLLNGRVMDIAMMTTTMTIVIMMEVNELYLYVS